MKTRILLFLLLSFITLSAFSLTSCKDNKKYDDHIIPSSQLPEQAITFIRTHFSEGEIVTVMMDKDFLSTSYEVFLKNGIKLEFDTNGSWTEVNCNRTSVPKAIIPKKIVEHVQKFHANDSVVKIERDRRRYEIRLLSGLEIEFDAKTFQVIEYDK